MKAAFTYAVVYKVAATCLTPLRTGGAEGDTEAVLRDSRGQAFLQGASLAGSFRRWLEARSPASAEPLLGSQMRTGRLVVSDGLFDPDSEQYIRPRLRIDPATGTAAGHNKFDMAHIGAGAKMRFTLIWLGTPEDADELETVERMLAALHSGAIRLGGQKSNGFGRVSLAVTKRTFNMTDAGDRHAWLDGADDGAPLVLPETVGSRNVTFTVSGRADSILIRAAVAEQDGDGSYTPNLTEGGRPILPGSSVKGAVRARAEAISQAVGLDPAVIPALFGRGAAEGDVGRPGCVWFEDAQMDRSQKQKITRIRINKFTGGVIRGGLFKEEPVSGPVVLRITAPEEPVACALLLYALRDLGLGLYNLGSGGAAGRGYLHVERVAAAASDGREAALEFDGALSCSLVDPSGMVEEWLKAWGGAVHEV